jgi:hypothetical protein
LHVIVAPVSSSRLVAPLAAAWTALAAGVSFGTIAFSAPGGSRIGAIPLDPVHLVVAVLAALCVLAIGWRRGPSVAMAVAPLAIVFLPWLPLPVPGAFLAWTGAFASLVWIAVAASLCAILFAHRPLTLPSLAPRRAALLAGAISVVLFSLAARAVSPSLPAGDEPHYLVITQSLLYDHDLKIENNHERGDYRAYSLGDLRPDSVRPGRNGAVYSIHAPGLPALVLPAFAIGGYHGVMVFLILLSAAGCALAWWLAWRATGSMAAAWFGWAVVTTSAPFLLETFTVFPDGPGAVVVLTGFWALSRTTSESDREWIGWLLHGLALATLPWMHTRFAVLAATLGGLVLVRIARTSNPLANAIAFLAVPAASALGWLFFFTVIYGTPDPSAPYGRVAQNALVFFPDGVGGLLFDQGFGLIATAPALVVAFAGLTRMRRFAIEWLVVTLPYLLAVATFAMWWAGMSAPARFLVPILLPLAVPAACAWASFTSRRARLFFVMLLVAGAWMSAIMAGAGEGRLAFHARNETGATPAPWIEWANHAVDLPAAVPAFVPQPVQPDPGGLVSRAQAARSGFIATLIWVLCLGGAAALCAALTRRRRFRVETMIAGTTVTLAAAAMIAMSIVWSVHAVDPVTTTAAQLDMLRTLAHEGVTAVDLTARRRLSPVEAGAMRIAVPVMRGRPGPRVNRPVAVFAAVPAGSYVMSVRRQGTADGWVMVGVGNDQFAIATQPVAAYDAGVRIDAPVDVRALIVRADEGARDQLQSVELRAVAPSARPSTPEVARRAVRYDSCVAFFFDDRAYPEPSGFWVAGKRETKVALQLDRPGPVVRLMLRNSAAANAVRLESGAWREEIRLQPGEERPVDVPLDASTGSTVLRIRSDAGLRPSDADPKNRDTRLLGVYVRPL